MSFERVHTMTDYYDGPRRGVAELDGRPHAYASVWADPDDHDDPDDLFLLSPIDDATLALALEDWAIWLRWKAAFDAGATTLATHPALPADRARHDELAPVLAAHLAIDPARAIRKRGEFRTLATPTRELQVRWTDPPAPDA